MTELWLNIILGAELNLKEHVTIFENRLISNSPRVKQLSFTVFESIQPISRFGGSTFSAA